MHNLGTDTGSSIVTDGAIPTRLGMKVGGWRRPKK